MRRIFVCVKVFWTLDEWKHAFEQIYFCSCSVVYDILKSTFVCLHKRIRNWGSIVPLLLSLLWIKIGAHCEISPDEIFFIISHIFFTFFKTGAFSVNLVMFLCHDTWNELKCEVSMIFTLIRVQIHLTVEAKLSYIWTEPI